MSEFETSKEVQKDDFKDYINDGSVNWECFHNWIYCICVVTFDLELGQALEVSNYFKSSIVRSCLKIFYRILIPIMLH